VKPHALNAYLAWNYRGWTLGGHAHVVGDMVRAGTITNEEAWAWGEAFLPCFTFAEGQPISLSLRFQRATETSEVAYFALREAERKARA
jgi:hypothetical protein